MPDAAPAPTADELLQRLTALEVKACYTDDLVDHLNQQVAQQQDTIDLLLREVRRLRQLQADGPSSGNEPFRSLRDELPPHY